MPDDGKRGRRLQLMMRCLAAGIWPVFAVQIAYLQFTSQADVRIVNPCSVSNCLFRAVKGKPLTDSIESVVRNRTHAAESRVLSVGTPTTPEVTTNRVTIIIDDSGKIVSIECF